MLTHGRNENFLKFLLKRQALPEKMCIFTGIECIERKDLKMSITTLTNLRDYLTSTLSTDDMKWLVEEMENYII